MLTHLSIKNYAIIEQISLNFDRGFTVITGETGAGKSILLGALSLILGNRADTSVLNDKDKKCVVEGTFLFNQQLFQSYFLDNDLDYEEETIVRREISVSGKSRAFVNDTPVTLSVLKELTSQLIDIHSQHQTLKLKDNLFQLSVIDSFAQLNKLTDEYGQQYQQYIGKKKKLDALLSQDASAKSDVDYLHFQINELEEMALKPGEKKELQDQLELLNNIEVVKSTFDKAIVYLNQSEQSVISVLRDVTNSFSSISSLGDSYGELHDRLNSLLIDLEDIVNEMENTPLDNGAKDPQYLSERLSNIYSLEQKHKVADSDELLVLLEEFKSRVESISLTEQDAEKLQLELDKEKVVVTQLAQEISEKRVAVFSQIEKTITNNLIELGMPAASFVIKHQLLDDIGAYGIDNVQFFFSANKGFAEKEIEKTASGGELSRLMLTIKSILAKSSKISSIIFDEIDTGVSGDIADKMASIMKAMSKHIQIIAITHLPQVAAKGEEHYKIYKETHLGKTSTYIDVLSSESRVEEIAKMLSGKELSTAAKENAKTLLENV